ncbi:hypothetical protein THAOC_11374, partial [Thalassiosira oceanica]
PKAGDSRALHPKLGCVHQGPRASARRIEADLVDEGDAAAFGDVGYGPSRYVEDPQARPARSVRDSTIASVRAAVRGGRAFELIRPETS